MWLDEESFAKIVMVPLIAYLIFTFGAMFYLGSCSGKTNLLDKGLTVKLVNGIQKL